MHTGPAGMQCSPALGVQAGMAATQIVRRTWKYKIAQTILKGIRLVISEGAEMLLCFWLKHKTEFSPLPKSQGMIKVYRHRN